MAAIGVTFIKWLGVGHALYSAADLTGKGTEDTFTFERFAQVDHITMTDKSGDEEQCKLVSIAGNVATVEAGLTGASTQDVWIEVWGH